MLFKGGFHIGRIWHNLAMRTAIIALFWIVIISAAHYELNFEKQNRKQITMGYMPVILLYLIMSVKMVMAFVLKR